MQGFNMGRYIPPAALDANPTTTFNQASGKGRHAFGSRSRPDGSLTVRFELPFAIWCDHCAPKPAIIGQGVRFNAAKRKVGNYYSTPIYSFRFTHNACGGEIEVRTDPKNTAYMVVSGARRRDTGDDKDDGSLVKSGEALLLASRKEVKELRETAFSHLEKTIEDRAALAAGARRIDELEDAAARDWDNPYERNAALRRSFRVGRKERERQAGVDEGIRERLGLGFELLPENEEDARRARLVDFGTAAAPTEKEESVLAAPLFKSELAKVEENNTSEGGKLRILKSERMVSKRKTALVSNIMGNTRIARDPFLERKGKGAPATTTSTTVLPGLKRKRDANVKKQSSLEGSPAAKMATVLVDYDSE